MHSAVILASSESSFSVSDFYRRKANTVTFARSLLAAAGMLLALFSIEYKMKYLSLTSFIIIALSFAADSLDGFFARKDPGETRISAWGGWYDAETDAAVLFSACSVLVYFPEVSKYILIPASARYLFALVFLVFPLPLISPRLYQLYSKAAAALFQLLAVSLWGAVLFFYIYSKGSFSFAVLSRLNRTAVPAVSLLILSSFILEGFFRIKYLVSLVPNGQLKGILRSYAVYYLVPFRRKKMARFYSSFLKEGDLAFDAGAHLGSRTRTFTDLGAYVVSFEPNPSCRGILETWFSENERVRLDFSSLGPVIGRTELHLPSSNPSLASVDRLWINGLESNQLFRKIRWDRSVTVGMIRLDDAVEKYGKPVFIKIDTEGFEKDVLSGLSVPVDFISFEFLPAFPERGADCLGLLMKLGSYCFNFSPGESMKLFFKEWQTENSMKKFIEDYPFGSLSGDIYAKLE